MFDIPTVTMTMRELDQLKCIRGFVDGHLRRHSVATRLGLTVRQVRRLVRRYEPRGPRGLDFRSSWPVQQQGACIRRSTGPPIATPSTIGLRNATSHHRDIALAFDDRSAM
jgi:hypothetical protein